MSTRPTSRIAAEGLPPRVLAALIGASALITLDGTATTIALPSIGREFSSSVFRLQWISNAPLVVLAALLLPAGTATDRFGRVRAIRAGLVIFITGATVAALARSDLWLIGARFGQGAGGALILPATLALMRGAYSSAAERARVFGIWAACTGAASAAGPLLAGGLIDWFSWPAVFLPSIAGGVAAILLIPADVRGAAPGRGQKIPVVASIAVAVLLGATAWLLMTVAGGDRHGVQLVVPAALAAGASIVLTLDGRRERLLPREVLSSRNCIPANASTFALYFGLFGISFLIALHAQQILGYSALRTAAALLPLSIMLLFAERFGRLSAHLGTRILITAGSVLASAGIFWIASGPHPLAFWSRTIVGTALFGLGLSLAVSALTHAAVAAVPPACAGAASGLNHAVVRAAGVIAIALLGAIAAPGVSTEISVEGFQQAMMLCAVVVGVGGTIGSARLRDEEPGGLTTDA